MGQTRWLIAAAVVVPLATVPASWGPSLAETKALAFLVVGAGAVIVMVGNPWVAAFAGWTVLAYLFSGAHLWSLAPVLGTLTWALLYEQARRVTDAGWHNLRLAVAASALFQILWVGVQLLERDPLFAPVMTQGGFQPLHVEPVGWLGNQMDLALYLGLALPLVATLRPRTLGWTTAGMIVALLVLVLRATVGIVAVGLCSLLWAWSRVRGWAGRLLLAAALALGGAGWLALADPQGAGTRPLIWRQAVHLAALRPFAGWGPGAVDTRLVMLTPGTNLRWNYVFNEWLQGWLELGALAPLLALGYLGALARRLWQPGAWTKAAECAPVVMILLAASLFSIPFRLAPVALLAALALGRLEGRLA